MYFSMKSYLKSNRYYTDKHASTPANKPLELGLAIAIRRRWKMLSYRPRRCWILGFTNVP
jgi:hypothetical protein